MTKCNSLPPFDKLENTQAMGANSYIQKILQREQILQHTPAKVKSLYMKNVWAEKWHPQSYFLTSFTYNNSLEVKKVVIPNIFT